MGGVAIILILLSQTILVATTGVALTNSISDLGTSAGQAFSNPILLVVTLFSMIITGVIIMAVAVIRTKLAKHFGFAPQSISFNVKRKGGLVLSFLFIGIVTSLIFGGFNDFIANASPNQDLNSLNGFITAILSGNIGLVVAIFVTIAVFGALANLVGHLWKPVTAIADHHAQGH
ncbi:MAG: hypothetical protein OPY03_01785 [Nitrosopumilus sp.]|nr:hypothetical protein [Nitrosopumilus sp.]